MEWRDHGALLSVRPHGETSAIIEVFTAGHGRHAGVVRGGTSRRLAAILQPGTQLDLTWRARLDDHLGSFAVEPVRARAAQILSDRLALLALSSVAALLGFALPEREPHPRLYLQTVDLLDRLGAAPDWPEHYLRWERALLGEMGFGLDLAACAVTGRRDGLEFVSPKSGSAVTREGAGEWLDRLLPLPACLIAGPGTRAEVAEGLRTTGHFLASWLAEAQGERALPQARARFVAAFTPRS